MEEENKIEKEAKEEQISETGNMTVYELGFLLLPSLEESKVPETVYSLKSVVEGVGGSFVSEGFPQLKPLSYPMSKEISGKKQIYNQAYFGWIKFEMEPSKTLEIKKNFDDNPNILRSLLIKTIKENTLYSGKVLGRKEKSFRKPSGVEVSKPQTSNEEIDKSIEKLVASQ